MKTQNIALGCGYVISCSKVQSSLCTHGQVYMALGIFLSLFSLTGKIFQSAVLWYNLLMFHYV